MACGEGPNSTDCCPPGDACDEYSNPTDGDDTLGSNAGDGDGMPADFMDGGDSPD
jgi:hypothetical protein